MENTISGDYQIHRSSYIDAGAIIGEGTKIWHFSHIQTGAKIGKNCSIGQNVNIGPHVIIGNNVKIQNNVSIYEGVIIEDDVFLGPSMVFTNVLNPRAFVSRKDCFGKTVVQKGATIGANATIICGHNIGKYSFIGAGSVVTGSVKDNALVYGNPAQHKGWVCECGEKIYEIYGKPRQNDYIIKSIASCYRCKSEYEITPFVCKKLENV